MPTGTRPKRIFECHSDDWGVLQLECPWTPQLRSSGPMSTSAWVCGNYVGKHHKSMVFEYHNHNQVPWVQFSGYCTNNREKGRKNKYRWTLGSEDNDICKTGEIMLFSFIIFQCGVRHTYLHQVDTVKKEKSVKLNLWAQGIYPFCRTHTQTYIHTHTHTLFCLILKKTFH